MALVRYSCVDSYLTVVSFDHVHQSFPSSREEVCAWWSLTWEEFLVPGRVVYGKYAVEADLVAVDQTY